MPSITQELPETPRFAKFVCPTYPPFRVQGVVLIEITVAKSGEPTEIRVLEGHPMLIRATMEAAKQWRFRPYRLNGQAVEVGMRMKFIFVLKPRAGYGCRVNSTHAPARILEAANERGIIP